MSDRSNNKGQGEKSHEKGRNGDLGVGKNSVNRGNFNEDPHKVLDTIPPPRPPKEKE